MRRDHGRDTDEKRASLLFLASFPRIPDAQASAAGCLILAHEDPLICACSRFREGTLAAFQKKIHIAEPSIEHTMKTTVPGCVTEGVKSTATGGPGPTVAVQYTRTLRWLFVMVDILRHG